MSIPDEAAERRALLIFERSSEFTQAGAALAASEPQEVRDVLARLRAAEDRARRAFPTEEDVRSLPRPQALPSTVGHYRLTNLIGEGGMGLVFAAERADGLFEHHVAIKLIHPNRFGPSAIERFARERALLARLDHPHIARLIDGGITDDGWPYIIMERIEGLPLDEHAAIRRLDLRARVVLLSQVCEAVQAAHAALVVHGDLKPDNILVRPDNAPRLLDFGVARLADGRDWSGLEPRTAAFCAPERLDGAAPTVSSDVFALGILIRLVCGGDVRASANPADRDLDAIVSCATARDQDRRYASVEGLRLDLGRWLDKLPVSARAATPGYVVSRFIQRHWLTAAVTAALLVALLGACAWAALAWQRAAARAADLGALAEYQLVELDRRLDALPHTMTLRAGLAQEAQSYLDRLAATSGATPTMRRRAADGLRRLALLQGALDRPSLGNPALAQRTFARALDILPATSDRATRLLRSAILIDAAHVASGAAEPDRAGRLLDQADMSTASADLLARYWLGRSETEQWNGRFASAIAAARRARSHVEGLPSGIDTTLLTAESYDLEAEAAYYAGSPLRALDLYARALRVAEAGERSWPRDRRTRWKVARERWSVGTTLVELGRPQQGTTLLEAAFASARADAVADPADHVTGRRYRVYMLALGQALARSRATNSGLDLLRRSVALRLDWWRSLPTDANRRRDWTTGVAALGDALVESGDPVRACRLYGRARRSVERLAVSGRITPLERRAGVSTLDRQWANHCDHRS